MTQVEFSYNGVSTIVQCNLNEKMKDIFQKFKRKHKQEIKIYFIHMMEKSELMKNQRSKKQQIQKINEEIK